jgi:predicted phosphodiesterase
LTLLVVVSDIHGNSLALDKFVYEVDKIKPDVIICLGDTIGYLDEEVKCYEILKKINAIHLMGNHEAMVVGALEINADFEDVYKLNKAKERVSVELLKEIEQYPHYKNWNEENFIAEFYHGAPNNLLNGRVYWETAIEPNSKQTNFVFVGNTHRSFSKSQLWGRVTNVGSLGLPRDNGQLGTFVIVDTEKKSVLRKFIDIDLQEMLSRYKSIHPLVLENFTKRETIADFG